MKKIGVVSFSPTGGTRKVCEAVAMAIPDAKVTFLDFTLPGGRVSLMESVAEVDHIVVGAPAYAGKVHPLALTALKEIVGHGKSATIVTVYGNKLYGIAPRTLYDLLSKQGFTVTSAGTFIAQHSYTGDLDVAVDRPDASDLAKAAEFGAAILVGTVALDRAKVPDEPSMFTKMKDTMAIQPTYVASACKQCGTCAPHCPAGIIDAQTGVFISAAHRKNECLGCLACVHACPNEGRIFKVDFMKKMMGRMVLSSAAKIRREPVFYC